MRTQLKSTLALVLALLICVSVFAACKGNDDTGDNTSSTLVSIAPVPSQAEIDLETGEIRMAYGSTFADLKQDLIDEGKLLDGETLQLFQEDKVTEITDEATPLVSGMIVIKKDVDGNELFNLTLVIEAEVTSQYVDESGNVVIKREDGSTEVVNSQGEVISTTPPTNSTGGGTGSTGNNNGSTGTGEVPSNPSSNSSVTIPSAGTSEPSIVPSEVETTKNVTLTIAGDSSDNSLVVAVMAYRKKYPNVSISIVPASGGGKYTTLDGLKMQLASNNAPDVVLMDSVYVTSGGYQNHLLNLQQFGSDDDANLFIESCWQSVQSQISGREGQYGLPFDCNTILQFYNQDLLGEAGVTKAPTTWSELTDAMNRLKSLSKVTSPFTLMVNFNDSLGEKNYSAFQWMMWLWRMGGEVLNDSCTASTFAEQPGIDALQMYVDMVTQYNVKKSYDVGEFLTGGTSGFTMMTNNLYKDTVGSTTTNIHFGVDLLPELKAGVPRYSGLGLYSLALPNKITAAGNDSAKQEEAMAKAQHAYNFIEFYATSLEYQLMYCNSTLLMPSLKAGEGQGEFKGDYWTKAYEQLRTSKFRPGVKNWDSIETYICEAINAAVNNQKSPQEALKAAATQADRQLK